VIKKVCMDMSCFPLILLSVSCCFTLLSVHILNDKKGFNTDDVSAFSCHVSLDVNGAVCIYRVIQEESLILWETIVYVILSKKVHMNMGPILNGYRDMVKRRYGKKKIIRTILRARTAIT